MRSRRARRSHRTESADGTLSRPLRLRSLISAYRSPLSTSAGISICHRMCSGVVTRCRWTSGEEISICIARRFWERSKRTASRRSGFAACIRTHRRERPKGGSAARACKHCPELDVCECPGMRSSIRLHPGCAEQSDGTTRGEDARHFDPIETSFRNILQNDFVHETVAIREKCNNPAATCVCVSDSGDRLGTFGSV